MSVKQQEKKIARLYQENITLQRILFRIQEDSYQKPFYVYWAYPFQVNQP